MNYQEKLAEIERCRKLGLRVDMIDLDEEAHKKDKEWLEAHRLV